MRKLLLLLLTLTGCSWQALSPYKVDIQQGNYVDQEMVAKLKPGMSKSQVRFVLGSPLIADTFHQDRWDYVFRQQKGGGVPEQRIVTAVFDGDRLVRLEGNLFISPEFKDPQAAIEQVERDRQLTEVPAARAPGTLGPAAPLALPASPPPAKLGPPPAQPGPALAAPPAEAAPQAPAAAAKPAPAPLGYAAPASPPPASARAVQPVPPAGIGAAAAAGAAAATDSGSASKASSTKPKTEAAKSVPPAPAPQQAGSFTDSIKKGFGLDVSTPPPPPPGMARNAPGAPAAASASTPASPSKAAPAADAVERPVPDGSARVARPATGSDDAVPRPGGARTGSGAPSAVRPAAETSAPSSEGAPTDTASTASEPKPKTARRGPPPPPPSAGGGVVDSLKSAIGLDVDSAPPAPPGRGAATAGAATGAAAGAAAGSSSSEGMLSGITKSVKKVFGADDDAAVPNPSAKSGTQPSTGTKKRDKDQVARPRPGAAQEQVGRPRSRAKEEEVARPDMPDEESTPAPKAKTRTAKPKAPPPASTESITDQVTSGVKKVFGVDGDSAPVAPPVPR